MPLPREWGCRVVFTDTLDQQAVKDALLTSLSVIRQYQVRTFPVRREARGSTCADLGYARSGTEEEGGR